MKKKLHNSHNYHLSNFLGSLIVAQKKKKSTLTYWPSSRLLTAVATALRDEGFITGFFLKTEKNAVRIEIFLKYYGSNLIPLLTKLKIYSTPSKIHRCSYKTLVKLTRQNSWAFFLSTPFGVRTSDFCLSKAIGGNLLFKIK